MAHIAPNTVDGRHFEYQRPCPSAPVVPLPVPCPGTQAADRLIDAPTPQAVQIGTFGTDGSDAGDNNSEVDSPFFFNEQNPSDLEEEDGEDLQSEECLSLDGAEQSSSMQSAAAHREETPEGSQPVLRSQAEEVPSGNLPSSGQPFYLNIPFAEQDAQGIVPVTQGRGPQERAQVPNPQMVLLPQPTGGDRLSVVVPSEAEGNGLRVLSGGPQRRLPMPNPRLITVLPGQPAPQQSTSARMVHDMVDEEEEDDFGLQRSGALNQSDLIQDVIQIRQRYGSFFRAILELQDDDDDRSLGSSTASGEPLTLSASSGGSDPPSQSSSGSS